MATATASKTNGKSNPDSLMNVTSLLRSKMTLTIVGVTPLLHNRNTAILPGSSAFEVVGGQEIARNIYSDKQKKADYNSRTAIEKFHDATYRQLDENGEVTAFSDGQWAVPAGAFKSSFVRASKHMGVHMTDMSSWVYLEGGRRPVPGGGFTFSPYLDLRSAAGPKRHGCPVRTGKGGMEYRWRAEFSDWTVRLSVIFASSFLSPETLLTIIEAAGSLVGVGDWRPEKVQGVGGIYGQFDFVRKSIKDDPMDGISVIRLEGGTSFSQLVQQSMSSGRN